jgi:FKBP-type peptidyl-prolyl cis-trans isomerase SlyD
VRVTKVEGDSVTVDGNHPLAGKHLNFSVTIAEVRAATEEEIAHGHLHAGGGCCGGNGGGEGGCCNDEPQAKEGDCEDGSCGCSN